MTNWTKETPTGPSVEFGALVEEEERGRQLPVVSDQWPEEKEGETDG